MQGHHFTTQGVGSRPGLHETLSIEECVLSYLLFISNKMSAVIFTLLFVIHTLNLLQVAPMLRTHKNIFRKSFEGSF